MQCREFYRDARRREDIVRGSRFFADPGNGVMVSREIALRVRRGQGRLAEHVVRVAIAPVSAFGRAFQGLPDGPPHDELMTHDAHRLAHCRAHDGLASTAGELAERLRRIANCRFVQRQQLPGQHQAPGRGVDEQRVAGANVILPLCRSDLVGNQPVGRVGIRDAQQCLGNTHQQHALFGGQVILLQEGVDASFAGLAAAHGAHELDRGLVDFFAGTRAGVGRIGQLPHQALFIGQVQIIEACNGCGLCSSLTGESHGRQAGSL